MNSLTDQKRQARQTARQLRAALSNDHAAASLIQNFFHDLTHLVVAGFAPIGDEIDLWPLLNHLHECSHQIVLPVVTAPDTPLTFRRWTPETQMQTDRYGVSFPAAGNTLTPTFLLVPLLAFTTRGERLGYGGGYYDRTLAALRVDGEVFACGVAYAGQEVADLPTDAHDAKLDGILTEKEFRTFK